MRVSRIAFIGLLVAGAFQPLAAQQSYSSSSTPTSSTGWGSSAAGGSVIGQSFTASGNTLNAFGFYAASNWSGNGMFQAFLFGMSGSSLTGSALYTSSALNYTSITTGWFDFFTGGLGLTSGNVYMAILAPVSVTSGSTVMDLGIEAGDVYAGAGGAFSWTSLPATEAGLVGASWLGLNVFQGMDDFALRLDYASAETQPFGPEVDPFDENFPTTTTPEPASLALVATGLIGLVGAGRVRRKRKI